MTLRQFLELKRKQKGLYFDFTFTIMKSVKDDNTPFYHDEYYQTPIRMIHEWLDGSSIDKYIVIKPDSMPIDLTDVWCNWYKRKMLDCCIVTTIEDLKLHYGDNKQLKMMLEHYDNKVCKYLGNIVYEVEV